MLTRVFSFEQEYQGWPPVRVFRHVLYWTLSLTFYGVINGSYYGTQYLEWFLYEVVAMTVKLPFTYFVAYHLFPKYLSRGRHGELACYVLAFALGGGVLLSLFIRHFPFDMPGQVTGVWSSKTLYRAVDLIYVASPVVVIKMMQQYLRQKRANLQLKEEKIGAELQNLKNQLQPHFLFNTLNNLYSMVLSGDKEAANSILKLSDIISYMLYECSEERVSLSKEISMLKNYIELEKIRYGSRLDLSFDVTGDVEGKIIPPLLLIPFVENAFKHGVAKNEKHSWVRIHLRLEGDELFFLVENNLPTQSEGISPLKSGIGLQNVKKRFQLLYPDRHTLSINERDSFLVNVKMSL